MERKLELRMYGLVPHNISPIQQGIQYGHAKDEYTLCMLDSIIKNGVNSDVILYMDWLRNWKTYIILNGGTTNTNPDRLGTLNKHLQTLKDNNIFCTSFYEPDLGDQLTGVDFIVDERVFKVKPLFEGDLFYADFEDWVILNHPESLTNPNLYAGKIGNTYQIGKFIKTSTDPNDQKIYQEWVNFVGGDKNVFLRGFLGTSRKNFNLA